MSKILGDNQVTVVGEESVLSSKRGQGQRGLEQEGISLRDSEAIAEEGGNKRMTPAVLEESSPWIFLPADFFNFFFRAQKCSLVCGRQMPHHKAIPHTSRFLFLR